MKKAPASTRKDPSNLTNLNESTRGGFTLVELIIVIAIIGILTGVVLVSTSASRQVARDERRQADLKEIQIDLAQYYEYYGSYPTTTPLSLSGLPNLIPGGVGSIPVDPLNGQQYFYAPYIPGGTSIATSYCVGAYIETAMPSDNAISACAASPYLITPANGSNINYMQQPPQ